MIRDGRYWTGQSSRSARFPLASIVAAVTLLGCQKLSPPFDPTLVSRDAYLCCNLHFNDHEDATDANYIDMKGGSTVPVGTRVKVTAVGPDAVRFHAADDIFLTSYYLEFRFGGEKLTAAKYFSEIFLTTDPSPELAALPPSMQESIRKGEIAVGMTKKEVVMSRGYPPLHRTKHLDADDWLYYRNGDETELVHFEQGVVYSVRPQHAP